LSQDAGITGTSIPGGQISVSNWWTGYYQEDGKEALKLNPGDVVKIFLM
jgi:hypothetical protein